jgi:hypothetical protein
VKEGWSGAGRHIVILGVDVNALGEELVDKVEMAVIGGMMQGGRATLRWEKRERGERERAGGVCGLSAGASKGMILARGDAGRGCLSAAHLVSGHAIGALVHQPLGRSRLVTSRRPVQRGGPL